MNKRHLSSRFLSLPLLAAAAAFLFTSCNLSQEKAALMGAGVGAAIGGVAGNQLAGRGNRTAATIGGAVAGAAIGSGIAKKHADPNIVKVRRGN